MLSDDNHPGIFTFLVGLTFVVLAGVGISLMVNQRFGFSSSSMELQRDIETGETDLKSLKAAYQEYTLQLARGGSELRRIADEHEALLRQLRNLHQRRSALLASREELQTALQPMAMEFARYRTKYRDTTWAEAVGQPLGNLTSPGGREYRQAVIVRVTDVGLEIRHEEGTARVQAPDLDPALQERFQWNDEERRARLKQELDSQECATSSPDPATVADAGAGGTHPFKDETVLPDAGKLEALRGNVRAWKSKVAQLNAARNETRSKATSRIQSSIPGTLETWQARTARLENDLSLAKAELAAAQAILAVFESNESSRSR